MNDVPDKTRLFFARMFERIYVTGPKTEAEKDQIFKEVLDGGHNCPSLPDKPWIHRGMPHEWAGCKCQRVV